MKMTKGKGKNENKGKNLNKKNESENVNNNENKGEIEEITVAKYLLEEGRKIAKEDFAKFSAIVAVVFSTGLWVTKSIWYAYLSGVFSVYRIDTCYINADNENVFLQIIQWCAILVILFSINYAYYKISVMEDESRFCWRRKRKKLYFG